MSLADLKTIWTNLLAKAGALTRRVGKYAFDTSRRMAAGMASAGSKVGEALGNALSWARQAVPLKAGQTFPAELQTASASGGYGFAPSPEPKSLTRHVLDRPLALAFVISIVFHLAIYGGWKWGKQFGWWEHQATWLLDLTKKASEKASLKKLNQILANQPKEIPLTFVEVDPALASQETPKETKHYGQFNSVAANAESVPIEAEKPKIDGKQDKIVRTEDVPRTQSEAQPLQPDFSQLEKPPPEPEPPGDLGNQKPEPNKVDVGMTKAKELERPRTLAEARQRMGLPSEKVRQPGGIKRRGRVSLDVKATPFGAYDAAFIAAVQQRWYDLIDNSQILQRSGKVVLEFQLTYDGLIMEMQVRETEVGELLALLCQRAVMDPAPYGKWPNDMRRMVGKNYREVLFTFYYY